MNKVLYNIDQRNDTTDAQKQTARDNIGAASAVSLSEETARAIAAEVASATYDSENKLILFKNSANTQLFSLDATAFVMGGMIDSVVVEDGKLKITFITESGTETVSVDIGDIFDANNYYTKSETDGFLAGKANASHTHDDRYYTETEVDNKLAGKANTSHTHDDRYYTETEVDNKLAGKANASHTHDDRYYTETEVDNKLAGKANASHTHAISDVTNLQQTLNGKQDALDYASLSEIGDNFRTGDHILVAYTVSDKKLKYKTIDAVWTYVKNKISSVLGLTSDTYGGKAATAGIAETASNVNSDIITNAPDGAYVPVIFNNGTRLKVVAGSHGLIMQKASDSDYPLLSCKAELAADADHANNANYSAYAVGIGSPNGHPAVGEDGRPIYINSNGIPTACTYKTVVGELGASANELYFF